MNIIALSLTSRVNEAHPVAATFEEMLAYVNALVVNFFTKNGIRRRGEIIRLISA